MIESIVVAVVLAIGAAALIHKFWPKKSTGNVTQTVTNSTNVRQSNKQ